MCQVGNLLEVDPESQLGATAHFTTEVKTETAKWGT